MVVIAGALIGAGWGALLGVIAGQGSPTLDGRFGELAARFRDVLPPSIPFYAVVMGLGGAVLGALLGVAASFLLKRSERASGAMYVKAPAPTEAAARSRETIAPPEAEPARTRRRSAGRRLAIAFLGCAVVVFLGVGLATGRIPIRWFEDAQQYSRPDRDLSFESLASTFIAHRGGNERTLSVTLHVRNNGPAPAGLEPGIDFNERGPVDSTPDGVHLSKVVRLVDDRGVSYAGRAHADFSPFGRLDPGTEKTGAVYFRVPTQHRFWLVLPSGRIELHPGELNSGDVPPVAPSAETAEPQLAKRNQQRESGPFVETEPAAEAPAETPKATVAEHGDPVLPAAEQPSDNTSPAIGQQPAVVPELASRVANRPISAPDVLLPDGMQWQENRLENGNAEYRWFDREMSQTFRIVYLAETETFQVYALDPIQGTEVSPKPLSPASHATLEAAVDEYAQYRAAVRTDVQELLGAEPPPRQRHESPLSSDAQPRDEPPKETSQPAPPAPLPPQVTAQPPQATRQPAPGAQPVEQREPPFQRRMRGRRSRR